MDAIAFTVNGRAVSVFAAPASRLADVLRDALGLAGTKIGLQRAATAAPVRCCSTAVRCAPAWSPWARRPAAP